MFGIFYTWIAIGTFLIILLFVVLFKHKIWAMLGKKYVRAIILSERGLSEKYAFLDENSCMKHNNGEYRIPPEMTIMDRRGTPTAIIVEDFGVINPKALLSGEIEIRGIDPKTVNSLVKFAVQNSKYERAFTIDQNVVMLVAIVGIIAYLMLSGFFGGGEVATAAAKHAAKHGAQYVQPPVQYNLTY